MKEESLFSKAGDSVKRLISRVEDDVEQSYEDFVDADAQFQAMNDAVAPAESHFGVGALVGEEAPPSSIQHALGSGLAHVAAIPYSIGRQIFGGRHWKKPKPPIVLNDSKHPRNVWDDSAKRYEDILSDDNRFDVEPKRSIFKSASNYYKGSLRNPVRSRDVLVSRKPFQSASYLYKKDIPSAVTSRDGIKINQMPSKNNKKKGKPSTKGVNVARVKAQIRSEIKKDMKTEMKKNMRRLPPRVFPKYGMGGPRGFKSKSQKGGRPRQSPPGFGPRPKVIRSAPAYGVNAKGNRVTFHSGTKPGNVILTCRSLLGQLRVLTTIEDEITVQTPQIYKTLGQSASPTTLATQWYFNPCSAYYFGGPVRDFARYFDKYRVKSLTWEYNSTTPTDKDYQITWCMCQNIDHWERAGVSTSGTNPTKDQIMSMSSAESFPAWEPIKRIGVKNLPTMYMSMPEGDANVFNYSLSSAAQRQTWAATVGVTMQGTFVNSLVSLGDVVVELSIELMDMSNLGDGFPHSQQKLKSKEDLELRKLQLMLDQLQQRRYEEKEKLTLRPEDKEKPVIKSSEIVGKRISEDDNDEASYQLINGSSLKPKKSSSVKSDTTSHRKKFDSTLGYPGEGPKYFVWFSGGIMKKVSFEEYKIYYEREQYRKVFYKNGVTHPPDIEDCQKDMLINELIDRLKQDPESVDVRIFDDLGPSLVKLGDVVKFY